jgi:quinol monooxygenase YgiN
MAEMSLIARIEAKEGKGDELVAAARAMIDAVQSEDGTVVYSLNRSTQEPNVIWFYEVYRDGPSLAAHGSSDAMKTFQARIADILVGGFTVHMLTPIAAKGHDL